MYYCFYSIKQGFFVYKASKHECQRNFRLKELFCSKTREIPDIDKQIENTFSFIEGQIKTYIVSTDTTFEAYSSDYGTITDFEFCSDILITTDTERKYGLSFSVKYITQDEIKGMTEYKIFEDDKDFEDYKLCSAGYSWTSPYDAELGILGSKIVNALGSGDENALRLLFAPKGADSLTIPEQIKSAIDMFDGDPIFTERADGLYGYSNNENDFSITNEYNYHISKNDKAI